MSNFKRESENVSIPVSILILDIEGTTSSISFVKDVLFPYVREHLEGYLRKTWDSVEFQEIFSTLKAQAKEDHLNAIKGVIDIPDTEEKDVLIKAVIDNVYWQMDNDRKTKSLKNLQGLIMEEGYKTGDLKGHVYDDVETCLKSWTEQDKSIYIYSSGSIQAQKLLFGYSEKGDLLPYIKGHFDTTVGMKDDISSYKKILEEISCCPSEVAFLTDIAKEARAAKEAGMFTILLSRKGNASFTEEDKAEFPIVTSFAEIEFGLNSKKRKICTNSDVTNENKSITTYKVSVEEEIKPIDPKLTTNDGVEMMEVDILNEDTVDKETKTKAETEMEEKIQEQSDVQEREKNMDNPCEKNYEKEMENCALEEKDSVKVFKKDDLELLDSSNCDVKDVEGEKNENGNCSSEEKNGVAVPEKSANDMNHSDSEEIDCNTVMEENNKNANGVLEKKDAVEVHKISENEIDQSGAKDIQSDKVIEGENNKNLNGVLKEKDNSGAKEIKSVSGVEGGNSKNTNCDAVKISIKTENEMDDSSSKMIEIDSDKDTKAENNENIPCALEEKNPVDVPNKTENERDHLISKEIDSDKDVEGGNSKCDNYISEEFNIVNIPKKTENEVDCLSSKEINGDIKNVECVEENEDNVKDIIAENKQKCLENKEVEISTKELVEDMATERKVNDNMIDSIPGSSETCSERNTVLSLDGAETYDSVSSCKSSLLSNESEEKKDLKIEDKACLNQGRIVESSCVNTDFVDKSSQSSGNRNSSVSVVLSDTQETMVQVNKIAIEQTGVSFVTERLDKSELMEIESTTEQNSPCVAQDSSIEDNNDPAPEQKQNSSPNTITEAGASQSLANGVPEVRPVLPEEVIESSVKEVEPSVLDEESNVKQRETMNERSTCKTDTKSQAVIESKIEPQTSSDKHDVSSRQFKTEDVKLGELLVTPSKESNGIEKNNVCDSTGTNKTEFPSQEIICDEIKKETQIDLDKNETNVPAIEKTDINVDMTNHSVEKGCGIETLTAHLQNDILPNNDADKNINDRSSPTHDVEKSEDNVTKASHLEGKKCDASENIPMETTVEA